MSADSPSSQDTAEEHNEKNMRKVAGTALAGTSIEWYDFFIYGTAAALVFPTAFFPEDMPVMVALIASFSTFAVGFIARPLGGVIFGHYGDRVGRKKTLVVALLIMGGGTTSDRFITYLRDNRCAGAVSLGVSPVRSRVGYRRSVGWGNVACY